MKKREDPACALRRGPIRLVYAAMLLLLLLARADSANASVALLMEEPYGHLGAFDPTGHSAVYLNHVCAASPTELRACQPGEFGVVISRYHKIGKYDWIAIPLIPYLYSVDTASEVPDTVDKDRAFNLRDAYRRKHLERLAPDDKQGSAPIGDWTQLVGSAYDRTIHGFQVVSTPEQDARFIAIFNDRRNTGHFNALFHNCADFSRVVLDLYLPHAIHRSIVADLGMTTPKQVAKSLVKYGRKHPELEMSAFVIHQVPGSVPRSHAVDGVAESLIKSKKYLLPMVILSPAITSGVVVAYLAKGRMTLPKDAAVFDVDDFEVDSRHSPLADPPAPEAIDLLLIRPWILRLLHPRPTRFPVLQLHRFSSPRRLPPLAPRNRRPSLVVRLALPLRGPLVPLLLTLGQRQLALYPSVAKIKARRDERKPLLPSHTFELPHLIFMQQ